MPVITAIVDSPDRISRSFDIVDEHTQAHGLVTSEMVPALLSVREDGEDLGLRLADHEF